MRLFLGTDEAGYGPNLGPLVIGASAWQAPDKVTPQSLYAALEAVVCSGPAPAGDRRLAIGDSKQLYKPGNGLAALERGVLTALAMLDRPVKRWRELWPCLDPRLNGDWHAAPWHQEYDEPLPTDATTADLTDLVGRVSRGCQDRDIHLIDLQAAVLSPGEFNAELSRCGNKAEVLSLATLGLARRMLEALSATQCSGERVQVLCDRHGGRAHYAAVLQHVFPEELVRVRQESAELSAYELTFEGRQVEFRFLVGGECMLPTALASMTAKYARELAMRPFNAFWQRQVPGLRATAGYPVDARRFRSEIRAAQQRLAIADCELWRER